MKFKDIHYKNIKDGVYSVSEYGDIYSKYSKRMLKASFDKDGYLKITLQGKNIERVSVRIATLVATMFLEDKNLKDRTVDHIDSNKTNNHYTNLRWIERGVNSSIREIKPKGEINGQHILTEREVIEICKLLIKEELTLQQIGNKFGVHKSTISNIKRKKTWSYLTKGYNFKIHKQKNKKESNKQREEIRNLILNDRPTSEIIKMGFPNSVVYRVNKTINNT